MKRKRGRRLELLRMGSGFAPSAGGVSYDQISAFNPRAGTAQADTLPEWTLLTGTTAGIQQTSNLWYAAKTTGFTGVRWSTLPVALAGDDYWVSMECNGIYNGAGDLFGPAARMSSSQTSFYAFLIAGAGEWQIRKCFEGATTMPESGTLGTPLAATDIAKITVVGDVVKGYVNDVLIGTYTDVDASKNTTGDPGVVVDGSDLDNAYITIRAGDMPEVNTQVAVFGTWAANDRLGRYYLDSCFTVDPGDIFNGSTSSAGGHASATVPHFMEMDFRELRVPAYVRHHGTTADTNDWTDVDVLTKVEIGDDWIEVATGLDLDNDGIDGWRSSGIFTILQPARYARIEVNATLNANNHLLTEEVEFSCVAIP